MKRLLDQPSSGFTLVELLVTMAIISILAALGIQVAMNSMEGARSMKCASNLREIGKATLLYASEHDGQLPASAATDPVTGAVNVFSTILSPYIPYPSGTADSVWFCPSAEGSREWNNTQPDYSPDEQDVALVKAGVLARQAWGTDIPNVRLSSLSAPAGIILFADAFNGNVKRGTSEYLVRDLGGASYFGSALPSTGLAPRHSYSANPVGGRFNAVFCDGHVETFDWNDPRLKSASFRASLVTQ